MTTASSSEKSWSDMLELHVQDSRPCFTTDQSPAEVRIIDVRESDADANRFADNTFSTQQELRGYLDGIESQDWTCRVMWGIFRSGSASDSNEPSRSVSQDNSWSSLQVSKDMFATLMHHHAVDRSFVGVPLCFYDRASDMEEAYVVPWTLLHNADRVEMFYTFKYAAHKPWDSSVPWVIRHMGVYQSVDKASGKTLLILVNPCLGSRAEGCVAEMLSSQAQYVLENPLWLHAVILSSYESKWKEYLCHFEQRQLPIVNTLTATILPQPLRVSYRELITLRFVESRVSPIIPVTESLAHVLRGLSELAKLDVIAHADKLRVLQFLDNESRRNDGFGKLAQYIAQRCSAASQLLSDTLAFKDQEVAQQQNKSMLKLTTSTVFLALLGLFYVPWSFFASLFATSFFSIGEGEHGGTQWQVSSLIWIYVLCSTVTMLTTIAIYYYLQRRRKRRNAEPETLHPEDQGLLGIARRLSTRTRMALSRRPSTFGCGKETV